MFLITKGARKIKWSILLKAVNRKWTFAPGANVTRAFSLKPELRLPWADACTGHCMTRVRIAGLAGDFLFISLTRRDTSTPLMVVDMT